jgi:nicotinamidase-related amidase
MTTALLIIDVQQGLCSGGQAAFDCEGVIRRINDVSRKARAAGSPVVVIQHESPEDPLRHGTPGWQVADGVELQPADIRLRKTATDSFHKTELHALLQEGGITQLAICGLHSEFCVDTTTRRALALGYPVLLVADAHSTVDNGVLTAEQISAHHNATLSNISSFGPRARLVTAADVRFVG